ncbi:MAG: DUF2157 domain-containing protein [Campylobacterota bacterium]|nr:DUF2157 domain-containing protein [Campylobacterota bacterium]
MDIKSKNDAQKRVDQINQFQLELKIIEEENIITLEKTQLIDIKTYHEKLTSQLLSTYDIDLNSQNKQLSLGMKIASFIGAVGLSASLYLLFYQFWGIFSINTQLFISISTPIIALSITMIISLKEKTSYFSKIFALITFVTFVINLSVLGHIFNIAPSPQVMLTLSVFAFLLAYAVNTRLLLSFGILSFLAYFSAQIGTYNGTYWLRFGERPENFLPISLLLFSISFISNNRYSDFNIIYRVYGILVFFIPVLILSNWGYISYMEFNKDYIEIFYQLIGFTVSILIIYLGIKKNLVELINGGIIFFTLFLFTKFFDWCWDWMPKYIFFLLIGLSAILMMFLFKKTRDSIFKNTKEVQL